MSMARVLNRRMLLAAGLATVLPKLARACGAAPAEADASGDRRWIDSDAVLYGTANESGVFRLRLNSNRLEALGVYAAQRVDTLRLSANKRWLLYAIRGRGWFFFDTIANQERRLEDFAPAADVYVFSPTEDKLAGASSAGDSVAVVDLKTDTVELHSLAAFPPQSEAVVSVVTWLDPADRLVLHRRSMAAPPSLWSLELSSGRLAPLEGRYDQATSTVRYSDAGVAIGSYCALCGAQKTFAELALSDGARVSNSSEKGLVVTYAGGEATTLVPGVQPVTASPNDPLLACGRRPAMLLGAFDGRYVVYVDEGGYWIYGARERRKALLITGMGAKLIW